MLQALEVVTYRVPASSSCDRAASPPPASLRSVFRSGTHATGEEEQCCRERPARPSFRKALRLNTSPFRKFLHTPLSFSTSLHRDISEEGLAKAFNTGRIRNGACQLRQATSPPRDARRRRVADAWYSDGDLLPVPVCKSKDLRSSTWLLIGKVRRGDVAERRRCPSAMLALTGAVFGAIEPKVRCAEGGERGLWRRLSDAEF